MKHPGPIDQLISIFNLRKVTVETIAPAKSLPYVPRLFVSEIAKSREASIKEEKKDEANFRVYTDGSGLEAGIGAAAAIFKKGVIRSIDHRKMRLGSSSKHINQEGEMVGLILGAWLIQNTPGMARKSVTVYSDSKSTLQTLGRPMLLTGQALAQEILRAVNGSLARVKLRWISAHSGVRGNERVDELAKEAAMGGTSAREDLPPFLRAKLAASKSAVKQAFDKRLQQKWKDSWHISTRKARVDLFNTSFPFKKYRERQDKLKREHATMLFQVRSSHIPLNQYLYKIKKSDTKLCKSCHAPPGESAPVETVNHFIFECEAHMGHRATLVGKIGWANMNMHDIMEDLKRMNALAHYIRKTGRFQADN